MLIFICLIFLLSSTGFAFQMENTSRVQVGIINFLYLHDKGYQSQSNSNHEIETSILFPAIKNEIQQYGMSNYSIKFEKVINGNLEYSKSSEQISESYRNNGKGYDLNIWGKVRTFLNPFAVCFFSYINHIPRNKWKQSEGCLEEHFLAPPPLVKLILISMLSRLNYSRP